MRRCIVLFRSLVLLLAPLASAGGCGSSAPSGQDGDGGPVLGPVSVPAGSPVTLSGRAADGSVAGAYVDPRTQFAFTFSVRATSDTSAVATFTFDTLELHVSLAGRSSATITMSDNGSDLGASVTGNGALPADSTTQAMMSLLRSIFGTAIRTIPLELNCGSGFSPVEIATLLVPWQVTSKYELDSTARADDVRAAAEAATCATFVFAAASPTNPTVSVTKPSGAGLVNLGNDDAFPAVFGFFPLDDVGSTDGAPSQGVWPRSNTPRSGIDTAFGPCNSMCRGACGADCEPNNCQSATGLSKCEVDAMGANTCYKLVYTDYTCGTHPACVAHDACYDECNRLFACGTFLATFCMHAMGHPEGYTSCDQHVLDEYGASQGVDWARGYGPQTSRQTYRYLASREYDATACPCEHQCVAAGTLVSGADGSLVPIESFEEGDALATVGPSGALANALVEKVLVHRDGPYVLDRLESASGSELLVTPNHPVWTLELGWVPVSDLVVGAHLLAVDPATGAAHPELLVSIVRAFSATDVVYNLKTSRGSYVAAGILVHNKCLARGSFVDTPDGAMPVEALRPGDLVFGQSGGRRVATKVLRAYEKTTILGRLPGRRLAPRLLVTENHRVVTADGEREASSLSAPAEDAVGVVYDLETETGNYWADGALLRAAE